MDSFDSGLLLSPEAGRLAQFDSELPAPTEKCRIIKFPGSLPKTSQAAIHCKAYNNNYSPNSTVEDVQEFAQTFGYVGLLRPGMRRRPKKGKFYKQFEF